MSEVIRTDGGSFTMTSGDEATSASAQAVIAVTMSASLNTNATQAKYAPQTTATDTAPRATAKVTPVTVDCEGVAFTNATLVTEAAPAATGSTFGGMRRRRRVTNEVDPDVVGMSIYAVEGCLLTRTTYKEEGSGGITYKCAMMCPDKKQASVQARHVVTDEWGACG